jgi:HAD superfamily hydrolase (TIGR01484 family)
MTIRTNLLASDLDGTLIPLDHAPIRLRELADLAERLEARENLLLAYVTGRDLGLAVDGIREHRLPEPDFLACDVGTSVYRCAADGYVLDQGYAHRMEEALGGLTAEEVRAVMAAVAGPELQPVTRQTPFKISYFLPAGADHEIMMARVAEALESFENRVQAVYSVRPEDGEGLVDLLPGSVAKDSAVRHIHRKVGLDARDVVYAGDSGNDQAAMLAGFRVVVVGNARPEFVSELKTRAAAAGVLSLIYFARAPFAAGVAEGCQHFQIF